MRKKSQIGLRKLSKRTAQKRNNKPVMKTLLNFISCEPLRTRKRPILFVAILLLTLVPFVTWSQKSGSKSVPNETISRKTLTEDQEVLLALLDSAYNYEVLKTVHFNTKLANEYTTKSNDVLKDRLRLVSEGMQEQAKLTAAAEVRGAKAARKGRRRGRVEGVGIGILIGAFTALIAL